MICPQQLPIHGSGIACTGPPFIAALPFWQGAQVAPFIICAPGSRWRFSLGLMGLEYSIAILNRQKPWETMVDVGNFHIIGTIEWDQWACFVLGTLGGWDYNKNTFGWWLQSWRSKPRPVENQRGQESRILCHWNIASRISVAYLYIYKYIYVCVRLCTCIYII